MEWGALMVPSVLGRVLEHLGTYVRCLAQLERKTQSRVHCDYARTRVLKLPGIVCRMA